MPTLLGLACMAGCAHRTVRVEVASAPAVSLPSSTVAVVAGDRECRAVADALIHALDERASIAVDPRSDTRLVVAECGVDVGWTLRQEIDATGEQTRSRERADLAGRSHALVAITSPGGTQAHLLGTGRDDATGSWGVDDMFRNQRTLRRQLTEAVAHDLVAQIVPLPRALPRRVYPRAGEGSARELHTLAVQAEQRGDLEEALRLAHASLAERPTERTAAYLRSLEQRRIAPRTLSHRASLPPAADPTAD